MINHSQYEPSMLNNINRRVLQRIQFTNFSCHTLIEHTHMNIFKMKKKLKKNCVAGLMQCLGAALQQMSNKIKVWYLNEELNVQSAHSPSI